jgi:hypothetical protein
MLFARLFGMKYAGIVDMFLQRAAASLVPRLFLAWAVLLAVLVYGSQSSRAVDPTHCGVCNQPLGATVYTMLDKVTHEKVLLCHDCATWPDECYVCGLPARAAGAIHLPDGRFLCERDGKTAVLDQARAREIWEDIRDRLDRLFLRFMIWPQTNVTVDLVDRVNLYDEFTVVGNDFECPDVLGYIHSRTNRNGLKHEISLMTALPLAEFQATCAHEYTHAWVFENVSSERRKTLSRDAHEGFCELMAYLLMDSLHEEEQMKRMLRNSYTRGQIDAFIAAEKEYGLNDVLDWVRWGVNGRLKTADPGDVRNVQMPRRTPVTAPTPMLYTSAASVPDHLVLKGIFQARNKPLALINDRTLVAGESAKVRIGTTNVLVRCLSIGEDSARVQVAGSGKVIELNLGGN